MILRSFRHIIMSTRIERVSLMPAATTQFSTVAVFHRCQHKMSAPQVEKKINNPTMINDPPRQADTKPQTIDRSQNKNRHYSDQLPSEGKSSLVRLRAAKENTTNVISSRYLNFLERYHGLLEKKFPGGMKVYNVFVVGFKEFLTDVKNYIFIKKKAMTSSNGVKSLTRKELEIYFLMPKDMIRVGPVLILSALPFAQYLVFPVAYYFPRHLLSSHFWTLQQKFEFAIENQRQRLLNYRPVLRHLQSGLDNIRDEHLKESVKNILNKLGSGSHPTIREIMSIKPVFETEAFSLQAIHGPHAKRICKVFGLHSLWFKRRRLYDHAYMLSVMDSSLLRQGIFNLKTDELKFACFLRGLNASNISREDQIFYLQQWMSISSSIKHHAYSLLLHLPILLAYNHPNNWVLLKPK